MVVTPVSWSQSRHQEINTVFDKLEKILPQFLMTENRYQKGMDGIGRGIQYIIEPLKDFNDWINGAQTSNQVDDVILSIVKLPLKAVRNILVSLYTLIKELLSTLVHPVGQLRKLCHTLLEFLEDLMKPETWTNMGSSLMGYATGSLCLPFNPVSNTLFVMAGVLMAFGFIAGIVKALYDYKNRSNINETRFDFIKKTLTTQINQIMEAFTTGLLMGVIVGAINYRITQAKIDAYGKKIMEKIFGKKHQPRAAQFVIDHKGRVNVRVQFSKGGDFWTLKSKWWFGKNAYRVHPQSVLPMILPTRVAYQPRTAV